jgi:hypothetical protein
MRIAADKDMLLNVMGYHHFHLDAAPHNKKRSDDVLFAHVTPDTFTLLGIFDHTVFCYTRITTERMRLWEIFGAHATGHASQPTADGRLFLFTLACAGSAVFLLPFLAAQLPGGTST